MRGVSEAVSLQRVEAAIDFAQHGNKAAACRKAKLFTTNSTRTFKSMERDPATKEILKRGNITKNRLGQKLSTLLDANTVTGKDCVTVPDNSVQLRTAELCLRLGGWLANPDDNAKLVQWTETVCNTIIVQLPTEKQNKVFDDLIEQAKRIR